MAINYPGSLDDFTNPAAGNTLDSPSHSGQHSDLNDAVEALEAKVGIGASPAGSATAGYVLVAGTADTTWNQVGYEGITSGTATAGQVLTAQGGGTAIWETPDAGGLVYINTITIGSAVSAVNVDNVFTSDYESYRIVGQGILSTTADINFRLRASSSDDAGSNYRTGRFYMGQEGSIAFTTQQNTTRDLIPVATFTTTNTSFYIDLSNPQKTSNTTGVFIGSGFYTLYTSGSNVTTTQFDGFSLLASSGTFSSGFIRVYGYRN